MTDPHMLLHTTHWQLSALTWPVLGAFPHGCSLGMHMPVKQLKVHNPYHFRGVVTQLPLQDGKHSPGVDKQGTPAAKHPARSAALLP